MIFAKIIKELRNESELTHQQLADGIGVSRAIIGHWESGKREPTADSIVRLAAFFDVSADYLLGLDEGCSLGTKNSAANSSPEASEVARYFESLNKSNKAMLKAYIKGLLESQNQKLNNEIE